MAGELLTAYVKLTPTIQGIQGEAARAFAPAEAVAARSGVNAGAGFASGIRKHLKLLAGVAAGYLAFKSVKSFITGATDAFVSLNLATVQLKRTTGGSIAQVSALRGAIQLSGANVDKSAVGLKIFSKNLKTAAGDSKKTAVEQKLLGTSFSDTKGNVENLTTLLPRVADKFKSMADGPNKTALALKLFGRSGTELLPFLNQGSKGIAALEKESGKLGLTLDDNANKKFVKFRAEERRSAAAMQGLKVTIGGVLLPVFTAFSTFLTDKMVPAFASVNHFLKTSPKVQGFVSGITGGLAKAGKVTSSFSTLGPALKKSFGSLGPTVGTIFSNIGKTAGPALAQISTIFRTQLLPAFKAFIPAVTPILNFFLKVFGKQVIIALRAVLGVVKGVFTVLSGVLNVFAGLFTGDWSRLWTGVKQIVSGVGTALGAILRGAFSLLKLTVSTAGTELKAIFGRIWAGIKAGASAGLAALPGLLRALAGKLLGAVRGYNTLLVSVGRALLRGLASGITGGFSGAVGALGRLGGKLKGAIKGAGSLLKSVGGAIVDGLVAGIAGAWHKVTSYISSKVAGLGTVAKKILGINSPSKVFAHIGSSIGEGMQVGISKSMPAAAGTLAGHLGALGDISPASAMRLGMQASDTKSGVDALRLHPDTIRALASAMVAGAGAVANGVVDAQSDYANVVGSMRR